MDHIRDKSCAQRDSLDLLKAYRYKRCSCLASLRYYDENVAPTATQPNDATDGKPSLYSDFN